METSRTQRDQSTETLARHFFGRADVKLQASLTQPRFARYRGVEDVVKTGVARVLSSKRKHPKKRNMTVSLATTDSIPSDTKPILVNQGTDPIGESEFMELVASIRKKWNPKKKNAEKPTKETQKSKGKRGGATKIRALKPDDVHAMLKKKVRLENKFRELFDEEQDSEALVLDISTNEKAMIELDVNDNEISTTDIYQSK